MNCSFKKTFTKTLKRSLAFTCLLVAGLQIPSLPQAHALLRVGETQFLPLILAGASMNAFEAPTLIAATINELGQGLILNWNQHPISWTTSGSPNWASVKAFFLGLLYLDETTAESEFQVIPKSDQAAYSLSDSELAIYNEAVEDQTLEAFVQTATKDLAENSAKTPAEAQVVLKPLLNELPAELHSALITVAIYQLNHFEQ